MRGGARLRLALCAAAAIAAMHMSTAVARQELRPVVPASPEASAVPPSPVEALLAAQKLVDLTEKQYGPQAVQLVNPLINLASTQEQLNDDAAAERNYRRAMQIVEMHEGANSHDLITALAGLGAIYAENRDYQASAEIYRRAIDLSRKLDGLLNPEQLGMVDSLITSYLALGDYDNVLREQQIAMRIAVDAYGHDIPRLVAQLQRHASWFESMGRYSTAGDLYTRAFMIASNLGKEKPLIAVEPLRGIAREYRLEFLYGVEQPYIDASGTSSYSHPNRGGEAALKRALQIIEAHPETGAAERAKALMDLGDWNMFAGYTGKALQAYRDTWAALSAPGGVGTAAFEVPVQVYYRPPGVTRPPSVDADKFAEYFAEVEFTVAADGQVRDVTLAEGNVPEETSKLLVRAIKSARYRPRFMDGTAVDTSGVKHRETIYLRNAE